MTLSSRMSFKTSYSGNAPWSCGQRTGVFIIVTLIVNITANENVNITANENDLYKLYR